MSGPAIELVELNNSSSQNIIIGQAHFIKTVEDIHELMVGSVPGVKFGLAFNEASGPALIRFTGTDELLTKEAVRMAKLIGAGHVFVLVLNGVYPINILPRLKQVPEVVTLFCATANPVQVVLAVSEQGRGVMGVIDGSSPKGVEDENQMEERHKFLRKIGYKL
jgi:uncharacterized protein